MSKGKFRHPVRIKLVDFEVPHTDSSFVVRINAHGRFRVEGIIPIAYFGYVEDGFFHVLSFSYSVQNLRTSDTKESYSINPQDTAMMGLEMMTGKSLKRR